MRFLSGYRLKVISEVNGEIHTFDYNASNFRNLGDCLEYLNSAYRENSHRFHREEKIFEWAIVDFEDKKIYTSSIRSMDKISFIDAIIDLNLSQYLHQNINS
jgi:hypothetical protein